jgi:hypothetical protein
MACASPQAAILPFRTITKRNLVPQPSPSSNLIALPGAPAGTSLALRKELLLNISTEIGTAIIPFDPRSYRDFMLYEWHAVDAARGFVRHFKPKFMPRGLRGSTGKDLPR